MFNQDDFVLQALLMNKVTDSLIMFKRNSYLFKREVINNLRFDIKKRYIKVYADISNKELLDKNLRLYDGNGSIESDKLTLFFIDLNENGKLLRCKGGRPLKNSVNKITLRDSTESLNSWFSYYKY
jgi:hypothetical protein